MSKASIDIDTCTTKKTVAVEISSGPFSFVNEYSARSTRELAAKLNQAADAVDPPKAPKGGKK